jgi:hypothetical protein
MASRSRASAGTSSSEIGMPAQRVTEPASTVAASSKSTIERRCDQALTASSQAAVVRWTSGPIPSPMSRATNIDLRTRCGWPSRWWTPPLPNSVPETGSGSAPARRTWSSSWKKRAASGPSSATARIPARRARTVLAPSARRRSGSQP